MTHINNLEIIARTIELCWLFATMRGIGCLDAVNDDTVYMVMIIIEIHNGDDKDDNIYGDDHSGYDANDDIYSDDDNNPILFCTILL